MPVGVTDERFHLYIYTNQYSIICLSLLVYNWLVQFSPQFDLFAFTPSIQVNGISIGKWATPNVNNQIWSKRVTKIGMKWNGFWWNGEGYARLHLRLNSIIRANSNGNELCVCVCQSQVLSSPLTFTSGSYCDVSVSSLSLNVDSCFIYPYTWTWTVPIGKVTGISKSVIISRSPCYHICPDLFFNSSSSSWSSSSSHYVAINFRCIHVATRPVHLSPHLITWLMFY